MKKIIVLLMLCSIFLVGCTSTTTTSTTTTTANYSTTAGDERTAAPRIVEIVDFEDEICKIIENLDKSTFCVIGEFEEDGVNYTTSGSGVLYKKTTYANGVKLYYMLTNKHVVEHGGEYKIYEGDGSTMTADVLGMSTEFDLAVLTFSSLTNYDVVKIGNIDDVVAGEYVVAMGTPLSTKYFNTATVGNVSGIRDLYIQHTAPINSGNSGGPLVDLNGRLIGINTMKITESSSGVSVEGMYFAIKSDHILEAIQQIENDNTVKVRPVAGLSVVNVSGVIRFDFESYEEFKSDFINKQAALVVGNYSSLEEAKSAMKALYEADEEEYKNNYEELAPLNEFVPEGLTTGVYIREVVENGPAYYAGILANDIIVEFNGATITDVASFSTELMKHSSGERLSIKVNRNGTIMSYEVLL